MAVRIIESKDIEERERKKERVEYLENYVAQLVPISKCKECQDIYPSASNLPDGSDPLAAYFPSYFFLDGNNDGYLLVSGDDSDPDSISVCFTKLNGKFSDTTYIASYDNISDALKIAKRFVREYNHDDPYLKMNTHEFRSVEHDLWRKGGQYSNGEYVERSRW